MARRRKVPQQLTRSADDVNHNSDDSVINNWTTEKCQRLLAYIEKNGFDGDVSNIIKHFPGHTETNFRQLMSKLEGEPCTLNKLIEMARPNQLSQSYGSVVPSIVELTATFENHPSPETTGGVDYGEIRHAIAALMRGEIPRRMNAPSAAKLLEIIDQFEAKMCATEPCIGSGAVFKRPVDSVKKNSKMQNSTLAGRRSETWSRSEINKAEMLLKMDLNVAREIYLAPSWSNPFRFPDEQSQFRRIKVEAKNIRSALLGSATGVQPSKAAKPARKKRRKNK